MASGLHGVNHIACLAKNIDETIAFYKDYLDIPLKNVVNNTPGHIHICPGPRRWRNPGLL